MYNLPDLINLYYLFFVLAELNKYDCFSIDKDININNKFILLFRFVLLLLLINVYFCYYFFLLLFLRENACPHKCIG